MGQRPWHDEPFLVEYEMSKPRTQDVPSAPDKKNPRENGAAHPWWGIPATGVKNSQYPIWCARKYALEFDADNIGQMTGRLDDIEAHFAGRTAEGRLRELTQSRTPSDVLIAAADPKLPPELRQELLTRDTGEYRKDLHQALLLNPCLREEEVEQLARHWSVTVEGLTEFGSLALLVYEHPQCPPVRLQELLTLTAPRLGTGGGESTRPVAGETPSREIPPLRIVSGEIVAGHGGALPRSQQAVADETIHESVAGSVDALVMHGADTPERRAADKLRLRIASRLRSLRFEDLFLESFAVRCASVHHNLDQAQVTHLMGRIQHSSERLATMIPEDRTMFSVRAWEENIGQALARVCLHPQADLGVGRRLLDLAGNPSMMMSRHSMEIEWAKSAKRPLEADWAMLNDSRNTAPSGARLEILRSAIIARENALSHPLDSALLMTGIKTCGAFPSIRHSELLEYVINTPDLFKRIVWTRESVRTCMTSVLKEVREIGIRGLAILAASETSLREPLRRGGRDKRSE